VRRRARKIKAAVKNNFRQRLVYPWELPSIMRKHIYTGAMGAVYFTLVSGVFFVYFGNVIGLTPFLWGVMGGAASLLLAAQILSAMFTQRVGRRKLLWFVTAVASRLARLVGILVAFWLWHRGLRGAAAVLIGAVCLDTLFGALSAPPWMSWLADLIPEREHGQFMGRRSAWISLAIICAVVPASLLVDWVPEERRLGMAVLVFLAAGVVGMLDLVIHGTLPEPAMELPEEDSSLRQMLVPLRDRRFRPWIVFTIFWTFSICLGGSLATIYFVEDLGIKKNFLGGMIVLTVVPLVAGTLTASWSGRLVDRVGPKRMLFWCYIVWATLPGFWVFATPATAMVWLTLSSLLGGVSTYAEASAANKLITRFPPPEHRAMYVAVASCLASLAGGLGAFVAGAFLKSLQGWSAVWLGWTFVPFHLLFIASLVLRFLTCLILVPRIQDIERVVVPPGASDQ
jgi:MFS family permease